MKTHLLLALKNVLRIVSLGVVAGALVLGSGGTASAPQFSRALDAVQGFNFAKAKTTPVGYITSLKIGGTTFAADLNGTDPTGGSPLRSVAVLTSVLWATGVTDGFSLGGLLSASNKRQLSAMLAGGSLADGSVEMTLVTYNYDAAQRTYFKSLSSDYVLKGVVERMGTVFNVMVANDASPMVQSPVNYSMQLSVKPIGVPQTVTLAIAVGKSEVKQWGLVVAP